MSKRIALAGNPNCGKTTLFNELTGSNQYVGNWPGVTVEKKEGKLKKHEDVIITDLPGIYSLAPYTLEEVVARNYLLEERPDVILNIIDGTNLERSLYLTTQLAELGIPMVIAINMMDIVRKSGDRVNIGKLSEEIGCKVIEISALKGEGINEVASEAVKAADKSDFKSLLRYSSEVEDVLEYIADNLPAETEKAKRWYSVKIFERDEKVLESIKLSDDVKSETENLIREIESEHDDDAESVIINERYNYISSIIEDCYIRKNNLKNSVSDKIDKVVTNKWLGLPIFAGIMFLVYFISMVAVGTPATDWVNDGVFGEGYHLFGNGTAEYDEAITEYAKENVWTPEFVDVVDKAAEAGVSGADEIKAAIADEDYGAFDEAYSSYSAALTESGYDLSEMYDKALGEDAEGVPATEDYGIWVPSIPTIVTNALESVNAAPWLISIIVDGILAGVGAVLGFLPQMAVFFVFLAFLEACGYMSRVAFILDRVFRRFGLSGKSFVPILIGSGCGVPGVMASRTIENEKDRRMTIMTTTFIPCSAKLPIIALIAGSIFRGAWWVAPSAYFIGIAAIVTSGIMLKKTKMFAGETSPFVMELPAYHWPTVGNIARSVWERVWSFIKKAGTVILVSTLIIWAGSHFGTVDGVFGYHSEIDLNDSVIGVIGNGIGWIFAPLGFGDPAATIATLMGLVAKEEIVGVFGVLDFEHLGALAAYSFLIFNLLCAPCFAAIGAIRREMNSAKWTAFAIIYECGFAYVVSLIVFQIGSAFTGNLNIVGLVFALFFLAIIVYMLFIKRLKVDNNYDNSMKVSKKIA
ncbi:MAG: ferrous iron transporter B [Lachnospiraceae bacterium]|nr:ferrous iron transporter B [Lachnospiraceae bacterium]MDY2956022.1 ferrous iron transporter B [Lachnospiraceae bacterium]